MQPIHRSSGIYNALAALVSAVGTREMNALALARLSEGREPAFTLPPIKKATVATMCPRCTEEIVEMDMDRTVPPYCYLCQDMLTRRYPQGVL